MPDTLNFKAFGDEHQDARIAEATAAGKELGFGWIPPHDRTAAQARADAATLAGLPRFSIRGRFTAAERRYALWKANRAVLGKDLPYVWQQTGSCFPAGAAVRMADGSEKPIEQVRAGDVVISHTGHARRVTRTFDRLYTGDLLTLHTNGFGFDQEMTVDHEVYTSTGAWVRADEIDPGDRLVVQPFRPAEYHPSAELDLLGLLGPDGVDMDAVTASDGEAFGPYTRVRAVRRAVAGGDTSGRVRLKNSKYENAVFRRVAVSPSLGRLVGLYLAEGGADGGRVTFTFSAAEAPTLAAETVALVRGLFGVEGQLTCEPDRGRTTVRFNNVNLAAALTAMVPGGLYEKRVPGFLFNAPRDVRAAVVGGWFAGDGYFSRRRRGVRITGVTASPGLARDMAVLSMSVGYRTTVARRKTRVDRAPAWDVHLSGGAAAREVATAKGLPPVSLAYKVPDPSEMTSGYSRAVTGITRRSVTDTRVYCLEVERDHSFLVNDIAVHNCVGAGGDNAARTAMNVEIALKGEGEEYRPTWWLYAYGRSRFHTGIRGRGEGSTGPGWAKAALTDGILEMDPAGLPDLPDYKTQQGWIVQPAGTELNWSDGAKIPEHWLTHGRTHVFKTVARVRNKDEAFEAIANGYPLTQASSFGFRGPTVKGTQHPIRVATWNGTWHHQTYVDEVWDHPELNGIYFRWGNNWGPGAHGSPTGDEPAGGVYIHESTMDQLCKSGEVFALSAFDGFPARDINWSAF